MYAPRAGEGGLGRENSDFCLIFGIPSWLTPSRDRSGQRWPPSGMPYVATEAGSRFTATCRELSPPSSPFPPPFFLCFLGFSWITPLFLWRVPGRLFVAGNTCHFPFLSSPFLFLSLSFFPLFTFPLPWVSLDAFVIAGNPSPLFFGVSLDACVVAGNTFLSSLSFFSSLLSLPLPPVGTLEWDATGAPGLPTRCSDATRGSFLALLLLYRHLKYAFPRGGACVCVTLVVTGIQLDCFVPFSAGGQSHVAVDCPTKRAAMWLISGRDAFWTYLLGCGVDKLSLQSSGKGLMSSADVHVRRQPVASTPTCEFGPFSV